MNGEDDFKAGHLGYYGAVVQLLHHAYLCTTTAVSLLKM